MRRCTSISTASQAFRMLPVGAVRDRTVTTIGVGARRSAQSASLARSRGHPVRYWRPGQTMSAAACSLRRPIRMIRYRRRDGEISALRTCSHSRRYKQAASQRQS
jgi:hypothetical protein